MKFIDMTEEQKARVIENNRNLYTSDNNWHDQDCECYKRELEEMGFGSDVDLQFSGFCSQGDGASFTTKNVNIEKVLRHFKVWSKFKAIHRFIREDQICYEIYRLGSIYVHSNTMSISDRYYFDGDMTPKQDNMIDELYDMILNIAREQADLIYRKLEESCNYYESDEFLSEHFEINEYEFCEHHYTLI